MHQRMLQRMIIVILAGAILGLLVPAAALLQFNYSDSGIVRLDRQIAIQTGHDPRVPPGMLRLKNWFLATAVASAVAIVSSAVALLGFRPARAILALTLVVPTAAISRYTATVIVPFVIRCANALVTMPALGIGLRIYVAVRLIAAVISIGVAAAVVVVAAWCAVALWRDAFASRSAPGTRGAAN